MTDQGWQQVADRLDIVEVLSRFHHAIDVGDFGALPESVFVPEAVWEWRATDADGEVEDTAEGVDAIVAWLQTAMTGSVVRHFTTSHVITLDGDRASSRSYMHVIDIPTLSVLANGLVTAEHVRTLIGWRLSKLRIDEQIGDGSVEAMRKLLELG
jgi:hypothetical protein